MMSKLGIDIEIISDTSGVDRALVFLSEKLSNAGIAAWFGTTVYPFLKYRAETRFANEGDETVGKWLPLTEDTLSFRESGGFGHGPINVRTGELERYITGSNISITNIAVGIEMTFPGDDPIGVLETKVSTAQIGKPDPSTPPRPVISLGIQDLSWTLESLVLYIESGGDID